MGIVVQGNFGFERSFVTKLENVSFQTRINPNINATAFKVKDRRFNFSMDFRKGVLHENLLFNYFICQKRF